MNYYEQLRTLLCEVPEIKKDLEELRFGCKILVSEEDFGRGTFYGEYPDLVEFEILKKKQKLVFGDKPENNKYVDFYLCDHIGLGLNEINCDKIHKVIGNPIEEKHILLYGMYSNINIFISYMGGIWDDNILICKYDNTKDFHQQDEEVYKQLVEYFNSLK